MSLFDDTRGVSSPVSYILNLSVFLVIMVTVSMGASAFMTSTTQASTENSLETTGQQFSQSIMDVDRLVRGSAATGEIGTVVSLPPQVNGKYYKIQVINESDATGDPCSNSCIILQTNNGEATEVVDFTLGGETTIESKTFQAGSVYLARHENTASTHISIETDPNS
ncbi:DUF7266 family protein [Salinibaculum rarum]|uniref:DUF7266 family protein n=1 Tax=Salinibaculum rarum TaxID=3058903 RepID=UPI00265DDAE4|nr:hypothetical protein [Salinibaculum sp. KK48]